MRGQTAVSTRQDVARELQAGLTALSRRLRQVQVAGDLTMAESQALSRLHRLGPTTSAELAREERISAQSMGATVAALESHGLLRRERDAADGRRIVLTLTDAGHEMAARRRTARTQQLADALGSGFTPADLEVLRAAAPLLERLAERLTRP